MTRKSNFPSAGGVPWAEAVTTCPSSSFAPGPPAHIHVQKTGVSPNRRKSESRVSPPHRKISDSQRYGTNYGVPAYPLKAIQEAAKK